MSSTPSKIATRPFSHDASGPHSHGGAVVITPTDIHAAYPGGAAIADTTGPWTLPTHPVTLQCTLAGGGSACTVTVGGMCGDRAVEQDFVFTVPATLEGSVPFTSVTSVTSTADPAANVTLQTLDAVWLERITSPTWLWVGATGSVSTVLLEDDTETVYTAVPNGTRLDVRPRILRCDKGGRAGITATSATSIVWGS